MLKVLCIALEKFTDKTWKELVIDYMENRKLRKSPEKPNGTENFYIKQTSSSSRLPIETSPAIAFESSETVDYLSRPFRQKPQLK